MKKKPKKSFSVSITALTAGLSFLSYITVKLVRKIKKGIDALPNGFTVTAHTGVNGTEPNSPASLSASLAGPADIAEVDLNFLEDGTPVLSHNTPLGECFLLKDAFDCIASHTDKKINVDVKSVKNIESTVALAKEAGILDRIFFTGVELETVEAIRTRTPEVPYYLNFKPEKTLLDNEEYVLSLVETVKKAGAVGLNIKYVYASDTLVRIFRKNGLLVSLWTANSISQMIKTLCLSPDNITTKHPEVLSGIIEVFRNLIP